MFTNFNIFFSVAFSNGLLKKLELTL